MITKIKLDRGKPKLWTKNSNELWNQLYLEVRMNTSLVKKHVKIFTGVSYVNVKELINALTKDGT